MKPVCCFERHDSEMKMCFAGASSLFGGEAQRGGDCNLLAPRLQKRGWMACLVPLNFFTVQRGRRATADFTGPLGEAAVRFSTKGCRDDKELENSLELERRRRLL